MFQQGEGVFYPFTRGIVVNRDARKVEVPKLTYPVSDKSTPTQKETIKEQDKPQIEFEALRSTRKELLLTMRTSIQNTDQKLCYLIENSNFQNE